MFTTKFGDVLVRFIRPGNGDHIPYIPVDDATALFVACIVGLPYDIKKKVFSDPWRKIISGRDKDRAVIDGNIQPTISVFGVFDMINAFDDLDYHDNDALRETARHIKTMSHWFVLMMSDANDALGFTLMDTLNEKRIRLDINNPPFVIDVTHDDDMWIAHSDAIPLTTESPTYEGLVERVWEIAPEIIELNGLAKAGRDIRLRFVTDKTVDPRRAVL